MIYKSRYKIGVASLVAGLFGLTIGVIIAHYANCLLYTSDAADE